ncbi:MAG: acyl-CoA dehydrogenase [Desulfobacteraceae bacterium]|nr:acyl-CoA dehydrogenase [Desulfobacteraceae bacterium]
MNNRFMSMKDLKFTYQTKMVDLEKENSTALSDPDHPSSDKATGMVLDAAFDFAKKELHPIFEEMDRNPPTLSDGKIKVHPGIRKILKILGNDGWISAIFPEKWGGENMPPSLLHCINFIFASANYSASVYSGLTIGAARLILSFGSKTLQNIYLPSMLAGKWQGTMALTEPEAGSSLGDLTTQAVPVSDNAYKIFGEKIFISAGDHDGVENVIHLMLARIKGAPAGIKGISLFIVPKFRPDAQGNLVDNDVTITQMFHKLGYRGAPIAGIRLGEKDNCMGYLVGQEHKGLFYMFQMMNGARLEVGMGATAIATAAYHAALDHCRTRKQGRKMTDKKDAPQIPIIQHTDVKRMLLFQRAVSEGALCLILQCGIWEDTLLQTPDRKDLHLLLELLTPIAKSYPSEAGIHSTSLSLQCFGGYGYCEDYPVEQHFRDMRIHAIHEGTTGIQGLDLLGRKVTMENGQAMILLKQKISKTIEDANQSPRLEGMACDLAAAVTLLEKTTMDLGVIAAEQGVPAYLADATLYLEMFGTIVIAWQWLSMALAASKKLEREAVKKKDTLFYEGKIQVATYFFSYELPKTKSLSITLGRKLKATLAMPESCFTN